MNITINDLPPSSWVHPLLRVGGQKVKVTFPSSFSLTVKVNGGFAIPIFARIVGGQKVAEFDLGMLSTEIAKEGGVPLTCKTFPVVFIADTSVTILCTNMQGDRFEGGAPSGGVIYAFGKGGLCFMTSAMGRSVFLEKVIGGVVTKAKTVNYTGGYLTNSLDDFTRLKVTAAGEWVDIVRFDNPCATDLGLSFVDKNGWFQELFISNWRSQANYDGRAVTIYEITLPSELSLMADSIIESGVVELWGWGTLVQGTGRVTSKTGGVRNGRGTNIPKLITVEVDHG